VNDIVKVKLVKDAFNDVYFDSHKDSNMYVKCLSTLQTLITADDTSFYNIADVENCLSA